MSLRLAPNLQAMELDCIALELFRLPIKLMVIKKDMQATRQNRSLEKPIAGGHKVFMLDCISQREMVGALAKTKEGLQVLLLAKKGMI